MDVLVKVWGDFACFTRPECRVERYSYDVMTPSAARGILDQIYWHPTLKWVVDRIYVCKPVKWAPMKRNEVKSVMLSSDVMKAARGEKDHPFCNTKKDRTQRTAKILKDVEYIIAAHTVHSDPDPGLIVKQEKIIKKRLENGASYGQPYLGCRECVAYFEEVTPNDIPPCPKELLGTKYYGWMLRDLDFDTNPDEPPVPHYFECRCTNGCIEIPKLDEQSRYRGRGEKV